MEKEVISYCAECFDVLDLKDRELANRKAEVDVVKSIVDTKDQEISGLRETKNLLIKQFYINEKEWKKARRKAWWRGFKQGAAIGAGASVLIMLNI